MKQLSNNKEYLLHEHFLMSKKMNGWTLRVFDEEKRGVVDWYFTTGTLMCIKTQKVLVYRKSQLVCLGDRFSNKKLDLVANAVKERIIKSNY